MYTDLSQHHIIYTGKNAVSDAELDLVADCLESIRQTSTIKPGITPETREELERYLGLAEAALRRAHPESKLR